jgi:peptide/nickel transport system substrate-binding protein
MITRRGLLKTAMGTMAMFVAGKSGPLRPGTSSAAATSSATPKRGGQLMVSYETDPVTFNGVKATNYATVQVNEQIYESLTTFDPKMKIVPALAERWDHPDPLTYVFHLRQGVKFHNGKLFSAEDVEYTFNRLLAKETASPNRNWYDYIDKVEVVNAATVRMRLSKPFAGTLANIASLRGSGILPVGAAEKMNLDVEAVGTGPFKLVSYTPRDNIRYARNPDYWEKSIPYVNEMPWKIMVSEDTRIAALRSGALDYGQLSPEGRERLKDQPRVHVQTTPRAWLVLHEFNCARKPYSDVRVRQAFSLAVDRKAMIEKAASGAGVLSGPVATGNGDWYIPPAELPYKQDLPRAKQLLAEAGYPNGFKTTIKILSGYPEFVSASVVLADQLRQLNIETELIQLEPGEFVRQYRRPVESQDFDLYSTARTNYPDPDVYLYQFYVPGAALNRGYDNPTVTRLIERGRETEERAARRAIYFDVQRILLEESPQLFWWVGLNLEGLQQYVKGYEASFLGTRYFRNAWLDK